MASVTVESAVKSFGTVEVLHAVSVAIADGEFVVLVGPSGCGKTTLLRMIAGLESVSGGAIAIDGEEVNDLPPKDRNIAMVFQNYALYPHMTASQNIAFSLSVRGVRKPEIAERIAKAAKILGLEPYLHRYPRELSGGQRQRVAMGRAIVRDPKVVLIDEPLSNLDAQLRGQMRAEIKSLMQRLKATTIYVTHDQIEAMTMADRIVVMREGRVEQIGTPLEVYDEPASTFVAGFIGSPTMNLLEGRFDSAGGFTLGDGGAMPCNGAASVRRPEKPVVLGIRPDQLVLADGGLPFTVKVVEPTGAETLLLLERDGTALSVVLRERVGLVPDEQVPVRFEAAAAHVFDAESGKRLSARP